MSSLNLIERYESGTKPVVGMTRDTCQEEGMSALDLRIDKEPGSIYTRDLGGREMPRTEKAGGVLLLCPLCSSRARARGRSKLGR